MEGEIVGEDQQGIGVRVIDNNGVKHTISVGLDGEIQGHGQDGYPDDPDERTWEEDEHVSQARRYAHHYVYRNTEYDTLEGHWNPDRVAATLMTFWHMPEDRLNDRFETFRQQSRSYYEDVSRPVELPAGTDEDQVSYRQNVYLDADLDRLRGSMDTFTERMAGSAADALADISVDSLTGEPLEGMVGAIADAIEEERESYEFPTYDIAGTSELYFLHYPAPGQPTTVRRGDPYDFGRKPDARIELLPLHPDFLAQFKQFLLRHLVCQLRDIYITMGEEPPPSVRVLGLGKHAPTQRYRHSEFYPDYFDFEAEIPGYRS